MHVCPIELEREKSYQLVYEALSEGLSELQGHDEPRFDVLHNMVSRANSLFCGLSKLGVEEPAKRCRNSYVHVLCQLFADEYSLTRAIHNVIALKKQVEYSWNQFKRDNAQMNQTNHIGRANSFFPRKLPEIERHSFLD